MKIYVAYDSPYESGGEICEGEQDEDFPNHETSYYGFNLKGVYLEPRVGRDYNRAFDCDLSVGDKAYIVVVRYSDGDTFSHSSGHAEIAGVFSNEQDANNLKKKIEKEDEGLNKDFNDYKPWDNYFGGLESVTVVRQVVEDKY
jgi:hypothetical protein